MTSQYFFESRIVSEKLTNWMDWSSGGDNATRRVVLPMIQRGAVWAPHKLLDLWDTLLRGMPLGAMMASETVEGSSVIEVGTKGTNKSRNGDIGLIDGQQRTLSMLAGWPIAKNNSIRPVAIWVDLMDQAQEEYLFRLWVTTKAQPYGYARASAGGQTLSKLAREDLRLANQAWNKPDVPALWHQPDFMPWAAKFALPLAELIDNKLSSKVPLKEFIHKRLSNYQRALELKLKELEDKAASEDKVDPKVVAHLIRKLEVKIDDTKNQSSLDGRIQSLDAALEKVQSCEFPVIQVPHESIDDQALDSNDINTDPPLAILFKRVGTGGEPLSNADYVYSVIKQQAPNVHDMVEELLTDEKLRAIYTPTTLVMSAVRLAMLTLKSKDSKGQKITDAAKVDKATFARLVRNHAEFISEFKEAIGKNVAGKYGKFATCLKLVIEALSYKAGFTSGLPKHALCLIPLPLLETIMAWYSLRIPTNDSIERSRLPMVRFVLQGNLCVLDHAKASEIAIKALQGDPSTLEFAKNQKLDIEKLSSDEFPDQILLELLCKGDRATGHPLPHPGRLRDIKDHYGYPLTETPDSVTGLRGWSRFAMKDDANKEDKACAEIYKRWWNRKGGYVHPMLLWLQRDYVFNKFEHHPALAGLDDETPFDFDHILPSAQWAYWTGSGGSEKFISHPLKDQNGKVLDDTGHWHIGNSIGNIHVLESGENRSLGDASVKAKLAIKEFAENAQILVDDNKSGFWEKASGEEDKPRKWDEPRALAFQRAVEQRTFALYSKFYADLYPEQVKIVVA